MSGFAVLLDPNGHPASADFDQRIEAALAPLGPDRQAHARVGDATLYHSLLAVMPEEADEVQPATLDRRYWLVGDLRLDARADLVAALRQHGRDASLAQPDGTLVLHAWAVWGADCAAHLLGDFAFAIWDVERRELFAARDQLGVAALLVVEAGDTILVTNAMRAARLAPGLAPRVDEESFGDFLVLGFATDPAVTMIRGVRRVLPGHALHIADSQVRHRRYWELPTVAPDKCSDADLIAGFADAFGQAVGDRMRAPTAGLTLSGGMDSGLVAGFARRGDRDRSIHAYTAGFDWLLRENERYFAGLTADHLRLSYHPVAAEGFLLDPPDGPWRISPEPVDTMRKPGAGALMGEVLSRGHRLMLHGAGGDQIASGSPTRWADLLLGGRWSTLVAEGWRYRRMFGHRPPLRLSLAIRRHAGKRAAPWSWLRPEFVAARDAFDRYDALVAEVHGLDQRIGMANMPVWPQMLHGFSVEPTGLPIKPAFPFFDLRVVTAALRLPTVPWLNGKHILRQAGAALLPPAVLRRRKTALGVYANFELAMRGIEPARAVLAEPGPIDDYVDRAAILARLDDVGAIGPLEYEHGITRSAGMSLWLRQINTS